MARTISNISNELNDNPTNKLCKPTDEAKLLGYVLTDYNIVVKL